MNIVIAGASGYIGRALIPELRKRYPDAQITALSRSPRVSEDPLVNWKMCDLFSLKELEVALPREVDVAFYLVHSMGPTAHLDQGSFADYDLILADNFARTLSSCRVKHVVYLGGLIPEGEKLSPHLQSRREVERVFAEYALHRTVFRAGIVVGPGGSSFTMLERLVRRLPLMILPKWTQTLTTPVSIETVVQSLADSAFREDTFGRIFDLADCEPLTYAEMIRQTARWLEKRRVLIRTDVFSLRFSRLWVSLITGQPKELVYPLIESLRHDMIARPEHLYRSPKQTSYAALLRTLSPQDRERSRPEAFVPKRLRVRSVQRLVLPTGFTAETVRDEYMAWLPRFLRALLQVHRDGDRVVFTLFGLRLLILEPSLARSTTDRQLLYIVGGVLAGNEPTGRLEFREVRGRRFVLAAIHNYHPKLPWYLYQFTQAKIHLFVMRAFALHLKRLSRRATRVAAPV